jgi:KaiC/GvpD/RAD55 family RecA-like ATPase/tetratricopeptide (TPR) repeat protein
MDVCEEEKQLRWLEAAKAIEQSLMSESYTDSVAAEQWQRIGFCYSFASRQAEDVEGFRNLSLLSVEAYEKAANLYGGNKGKRTACFSFAEYTRSWIAINSSEKSLVLDKCRILGLNALEEFRNSGDDLNYGATANTLLLCLFECCNIAPTLEEKRRIVQEGIDNAAKAISVLSRTENKRELVFALSVASLLAWYAANISELEEERKEFASRCLNYSEKASALSKDVNDLYVNAILLWAKTLSTLFFTQRIESSSEYAKEMLQLASAARDNYYKGVAFYLLAFVSDWMVPGEANPEKKRARYEEIIKYAEEGIKYLKLVCNDSLAAETYRFYAESHFYLAQEFAQTPIEKIAFSKKAMRIGEKGLEFAVRSGSPDSLGSALHALSKAYHYYSLLEPRKEEKSTLLGNALGYRKEYVRTIERAFPSNIWILGVGLFYAGKIEADLAKMEKTPENKVSFLESAVSDTKAGVTYCDKWIESRPVSSLIAIVADFEDTYGGLLNERYLLTAQKDSLDQANKVFSNAAAKFKKVDLPSRVAESYWKIAGNLDQVGDYEGAAENFENAFAGYKAAAQKVQHFSDFYLDYSIYMKAWNEIESAKLAHNNEKFVLAMQHYERTSNLLKQSKLWGYLSSNFQAWSFLEQAEDLSRKERPEESVEVFQKTIKLFQESKCILKIEIDKITRKDERELVERLIKASDIREQYGCGRIAIEEAKIFDMHGDHKSSSEKYGLAAEIFQKITEVSSEQTGKELRPLVFLCQAWHKMTLAESKHSPILYEEAAELFRRAKESTSGESAGLLALAHSTFCAALEAGTEFEITRNMAMYSEAKKYLQEAANYYLKAGFETASEYAQATERLFDAYVYMDNAKNEMDSDKESMLYLMAEKVLRESVDSFTRAKYPGKTEQVQQLLLRVREERELAVSLSELLHAPSITSSTASFATLSPDEEKAVGLERFEHGEIQTKVVQHGTDFKVGEVITFEIQIMNVGKEAVSLNRIENLLPAGFQLIGKPDYSSFEGLNLLLKGKHLESLQTDEIKIALRSIRKGTTEVKPRIVCIDETGRQFFYDTESATFNISEATLSGRLSTGYPDLDNLMLGGLPENYAVVLTSPSSDERELLIRRFLEAGAKAGQTTFYITVEAGIARILAEDFQSNFYLFICNPRADVMVKNLPNIFKLKGVESLTDIDISLTKSFRTLDPSKTGPKRACIEVVSDVLLQHHAVVTRKWLSGLIPELRSKGFTTLVVVNPQMHPQEEVQAILGLFEGEIKISEKETVNGLEKVLRIRKLYNQRYMENELILDREKLES